MKLGRRALRVQASLMGAWGCSSAAELGLKLLRHGKIKEAAIKDCKLQTEGASHHGGYMPTVWNCPGPITVMGAVLQGTQVSDLVPSVGVVGFVFFAAVSFL